MEATRQPGVVSRFGRSVCKRPQSLFLRGDSEHEMEIAGSINSTLDEKLVLISRKRLTGSSAQGSVRKVRGKRKSGR